jgi:hypothetical protein
LARDGIGFSLKTQTCQFVEESRINPPPSQRRDYLVGSENPLFSFLARFAALFSIRLFSGFFLFCFLLSLPLLMLNAPSGMIGCPQAMPCLSIYAASSTYTASLHGTAVFKLFPAATLARLISSDFLLGYHWFHWIQQTI